MFWLLINDIKLCLFFIKWFIEFRVRTKYFFYMFLSQMNKSSGHTFKENIGFYALTKECLDILSNYEKKIDYLL